MSLLALTVMPIVGARACKFLSLDIDKFNLSSITTEVSIVSFAMGMKNVEDNQPAS